MESEASSSRRWTFEALARNIHRFTVQFDSTADDWWALLQSDVHWDNPHCDRAALSQHWHAARERDAPILDNGDFFCAMQGKWDKRANKDDLREEHRTGDYLDALVRTAAEALSPYADLLTLRGQGNHETGVLKKHETNLTDRLVERLKAITATTPIQLGGYSGFVIFHVKYSGLTFPLKLYYHHGYGGGGPVTRGVIQTNRQAVYLADADFVWTGHTHDAWQVPIARVRLNQDCTKVVHCRQVHFRTPGYKEEYSDGYGGFHIERGGPPKPTGAVWLRLRLLPNRGGVDADLIEAR